MLVFGFGEEARVPRKPSKPAESMKTQHTQARGRNQTTIPGGLRKTTKLPSSLGPDFKSANC